MTIYLQEDFAGIAQEVLREIGHETITFEALKAAEDNLRKLYNADGVTERVIKEAIGRYSVFIGESFVELLGTTHCIVGMDALHEELCVGIDLEADIYIDPRELAWETCWSEDFSIVSMFHYVKVSMNQSTYLSPFPDLIFPRYGMDMSAAAN